jgi:hypothetical protein
MIFGVCVCKRWQQRDDDRAMVEMLMGDPEALGLPPGLSGAQLARMAVWNWAGPEEAHAKSVAGGIETCNVCMEDLETGDAMRLLPCKHAFHVPCIDTWLARSTLCPICRAELRTPEEVAADRFERHRRALEMAGGRADFGDLLPPPPAHFAGAAGAPPAQPPGAHRPHSPSLPGCSAHPGRRPGGTPSAPRGRAPGPSPPRRPPSK